MKQSLKPQAGGLGHPRASQADDEEETDPPQKWISAKAFKQLQSSLAAEFSQKMKLAMEEMKKEFAQAHAPPSLPPEAGSRTGIDMAKTRKKVGYVSDSSSSSDIDR